MELATIVLAKSRCMSVSHLPAVRKPILGVLLAHLLSLYLMAMIGSFLGTAKDIWLKI